MPQFDWALENLEKYRCGEKGPGDFDAFWKRTLEETAAAGPVAAHFVQVADSWWKTVDVYDVTFRGYGGQVVKGWFLEPAGNEVVLPCVVTFVGYGGGRGLAVEHLAPAAAGFAHFVMDTRGQGSVWTVGATADPEGSGPSGPGFMTKGISSRETYYYRRVFVDGVRAVEAAASHPRVDPERIAVTGGSQGGGISLAVAGLMGKRVKLCMPDVPFLCHFSRATRIVDSMPYGEIALYLKAHRGEVGRVYETLSYFDGVHFAKRVKARVLMSVGLMDPICPPSTVYAAYNEIRGTKEMVVYEFNTHEGGGPFQVERRMGFAAEWL